MKRVAAVAAAVGAAAPSAAGAPAVGAPPAAPPAARRGAFFGAALGGGNLRLQAGPSEEPADVGSLILQGHLGGFLTPRFGIGVGVALSVGTLDEDAPTEVHVGQSNLVLFAQYWFLPRLWLRAGVGSATVALTPASGGDAVSYPGASFVGTAGFEVVQTARYAMSAGIGLWAAGYEGDLDASTTGNFVLELSWF